MFNPGYRVYHELTMVIPLAQILSKKNDEDWLQKPTLRGIICQAHPSPKNGPIAKALAKETKTEHAGKAVKKASPRRAKALSTPKGKAKVTWHMFGLTSGKP